MAIKTKDGMVRPEPVCFTLDSSALGITFELRNKTALFATYAFLSHAQLTQDEEIILHYSFGVVTVIGQRLGRIFELLQKHELSAISCDTSKTAQSEEPQIRVIEYQKNGNGE